MSAVRKAVAAADERFGVSRSSATTGADADTLGAATPPDTLPAQWLSFQPDVVELEHGVPGLPARWVLYTILGLLISALAWTSLAKVDRVVVARGQLITSQQKFVVQPISTGIVRAFEVEVGQRVREGQVLATLDPTFAEAERRKLEEEVASYRAHLARLRAEHEEHPFQPADPDAEMRLQREIHQRRQAEFDSRLATLDSQAQGKRRQIEANRSQLETLRSRRRNLRSIEGMYERLLQRSEGSRVQHLEAVDSRIHADAQIQQLEGGLQALRADLQDIAAEREAFIATRRAEIAEELNQLQLRLRATTQELEKARRLSGLVELKSPADAIVLERATYSVGAVVREAEPLVTLMPLDSELQAEIEVAAHDVGRVRVGDSVRVKLDAFPFQRHGTLTASLSVISEDVFVPESGAAPGTAGFAQSTAGFAQSAAGFAQSAAGSAQSAAGAAYYRCRLRLGPAELKAVPNDFRLIPGMAVTAEIRIGDRRLIEYVLYPVTRVLDEGMREP
ncbi:MAG: HlyD family type I secretion periplasmic adaptor subunit [Gammaproteobacteria bacterium]|nr:HlyD family type I secretion periplasmic adaptor subunit [Gammaproteobacteria bacterium]